MNIQIMMITLFERGYLREFKKRVASLYPGQESRLVNQVKQDAEALYKANEAMAIDAPAVSNLKMTSLALAGYRVLLTCGLERRAALSLVKGALIEPSRKQVGLFMLVLRFHPDQLALMASISTSKEKHAYGAAFIMEHETDNMQTYFTTNVTKCLYHDFFCANGAPELTPIFCAFDDVWGDKLQGDKLGVQFSRPTTIGNGDDMCRFQFRRTVRR